MKQFLCILIFIMSVGSVFGQTPLFIGKDLNLISTDKQEKKIKRKFRRKECYNPKDEYNYLFIYNLDFKERPTPQSLKDGSAFREVQYVFRKRKKFPYHDIVIYNQKNEAIGSVSYFCYVYCFYNRELGTYKEYDYLVDYYLENSPDIIFTLSLTIGELYFAAKGDDIKVLMYDKEVRCVLELDQFVENYWDECYPKAIMDIKYMKE
ncbi:hypothetical protein EYV94_16420 [Puteibacter caeruleilacunae]|nr:hypothetical protein EYV94_16420 [Puteibacter caeruleilacunae]